MSASDPVAAAPRFLDRNPGVRSLPGDFVFGDDDDDTFDGDALDGDDGEASAARRSGGGIATGLAAAADAAGVGAADATARGRAGVDATDLLPLPPPGTFDSSIT